MRVADAVSLRVLVRGSQMQADDPLSLPMHQIVGQLARLGIPVAINEQLPARFGAHINAEDLAGCPPLPVSPDDIAVDSFGLLSEDHFDLQLADAHAPQV